MPLQQVIQYSAAEILELSNILEKRSGQKPCESEIRKALVYCTKQIYPNLVITDMRFKLHPIAAVFEMAEACLEQAC